MEYPIWVQVFIAAFAVFGVYAALRMLAERLFSADNIGIAVHVRTEADVCSLGGLLREASDTGLFQKKRPLTVLFYPDAVAYAFQEDGEPRDPVGELLLRYRADYCLTERK